MDQHHAQFLKTLVACSVGTRIVTPENIAPVVQVSVLQWELAAVEGPEEPDPVVAASTLPTTQSMFSSHGVSRQFQPLVALPYSLLLIH